MSSYDIAMIVLAGAGVITAIGALLIHHDLLKTERRIAQRLTAEWLAE